MLKKEILFHSGSSFVYLVLITLLGRHFNWEILWFWLGGVIGTFLLDLDHLISIYTTEFNSERATLVRGEIERKRYKEAFKILILRHKELTQGVFHNALFQIVFLIFCFYILTTSVSLIAKGLVMAAALHLLVDEMMDFKNFKNWFFWNIKRQIEDKEQKIYLGAVIFLFFLQSLLLIL